MPFIKRQDPKKLKQEGVAIGMYAMPKSMTVTQVVSGYGLFLIIHEKDGLYFLGSPDGQATWSIKKSLVDVYI